MDRVERAATAVLFGIISAVLIAALGGPAGWTPFALALAGVGAGLAIAGGTQHGRRP